MVTDNNKKVVALGKFDGVHTGHMQLIKTASHIAKKLGLKTAVYVISPVGENLTSGEQKYSLVKSAGADEMIEQPLSEDFRKMTPEEFVKEILVNTLCAAHVAVGYNFKFGINRCGNAETLKQICKKYNVGVTVIDKVMVDDCLGKAWVVSSTRIRQLLKNGDIENAKKALGRYYSICGVGKEGKHLGSKLGFPTVNLYPDKNVFVPKFGVYASKVSINGNKYNAVTNVGVNPTVENDKNIKVESHIFDYVGNSLYGADVCVEFVKFLRCETKFENADVLKQQIEKDKCSAKKYFKECK